MNRFTYVAFFALAMSSFFTSSAFAAVQCSLECQVTNIESDGTIFFDTIVSSATADSESNATEGAKASCVEAGGRVVSKVTCQ